MGESFINGRVVLHPGNCLDVLARLEECSVDSCVTDPPYHLTSIVKRMSAPNAAPVGFASDGRYQRLSGGFMGKLWDGGSIAFDPETWRAVYRVLKPGGHLLAMGGTRTFHRLACAIEDAGFEIRDTISWLYGSGFPKSHDVSKGIDKRGGQSIAWFGPWLRRERERLGISQRDLTERGQFYGSINHGGAVANWELGLNLPTAEQFNSLCEILNLPFARIEEAEREIIGRSSNGIAPQWVANGDAGYGAEFDLTVPTTTAARQWEGWGTALKPACELIVLARKPLSEPTVAANVLKHGTGALNIDACRVAVTGQRPYAAAWENDQNLCVSCAERVASTTKPLTRETKASIATKPVEQTLNGKGDLNRADIFKPDIGCSDGTRAEDISTSSNTVRFGNETTDQFQTASKSTMSTATKPTTGSRTCSVCGEPITLSNTPPTRHEQSGSRPTPRDRANTARWPANLLHDGSDEVVAAFPETATGFRPIQSTAEPNDEGRTIYGNGLGHQGVKPYDDCGSAARFFYTAKADADDRLGSKHPTVKPLDLMQWLVRLVTPKGGTVLDPFAGTGTTGEAAWREGAHAVLIEAEADYQADIRRRMALALAGPDERSRESIKAKNLPVDYGPLFALSDAAE